MPGRSGSARAREEPRPDRCRCSRVEAAARSAPLPRRTAPTARSSIVLAKLQVRLTSLSVRLRRRTATDAGSGAARAYAVRPQAARARRHQTRSRRRLRCLTFSSSRTKRCRASRWTTSRRRRTTSCAMNHGLQRIESGELPLSNRLLREVHERLMAGVRGGDKASGRVSADAELAGRHSPRQRAVRPAAGARRSGRDERSGEIPSRPTPLLLKAALAARAVRDDPSVPGRQRPCGPAA